MPSTPLDSGWNFSPVFELIDSDTHDVGSPTLRPETRTPVTLSDGGVGLGNFWKLYESLGMPTDVAVPPLPPLDESELSNSDDALLPSPVIEAIRSPSKETNTTLEQPDNNDTTINTLTGLTKKQRQKARKQAEKARQEHIIKDKPQDTEIQTG